MAETSRTDCNIAGTEDSGPDYSVLQKHLQTVLSAPLLEPRRVFHGRGHLVPGLVHLNIDWYPPVLLISAYEPVNNIPALLEVVSGADINRLVRSIILQHRRRSGSHSERLWGADIACCLVEEDGLTYEVRPGANRNAGLFLDTRPLRQTLRSISQDRRILNLFAYTCSLSVAALAGGALSVTNVDMNRASLQWGLRNHALNQHPLLRISSLPHNVFKSWGKIRKLGPYDIVLIDPPSRQRGSFDAEKNYHTVIKQLPELLQPGAHVYATVNSPFLGRDFLPDLVRRWAPALSPNGSISAAPEFQERDPERGLKIYHFKNTDRTPV